MKQITIKDAVVDEVVFRPNDETVILSIAYHLIDDKDQPVVFKRLNLKKDEIPNVTQAISNFITKVIASVKTREDLS